MPNAETYLQNLLKSWSPIEKADENSRQGLCKFSIEANGFLSANSWEHRSLGGLGSTDGLICLICNFTLREWKYFRNFFEATSFPGFWNIHLLCNYENEAFTLGEPGPHRTSYWRRSFNSPNNFRTEYKWKS
jgi:hypothetical protein